MYVYVNTRVLRDENAHVSQASLIILIGSLLALK